MLMLYFTIFKTYLAIINATVMIKYIVLKPHNTSRPRLTKECGPICGVLYRCVRQRGHNLVRIL